MKRVEADKEWSLMCPHECPGLHDVWGEEFEQLYERCGGIVCLLPLDPPCTSTASMCCAVAMSVRAVPDAQ